METFNFVVSLLRDLMLFLARVAEPLLAIVLVFAVLRWRGVAWWRNESWPTREGHYFRKDAHRR
jgi:hypothetical protein